MKYIYINIYIFFLQEHHKEIGHRSNDVMETPKLMSDVASKKCNLKWNFAVIGDWRVIDV